MADRQKPRARVNDDGTVTVTHDGLQNVVANLGTANDKRSYNRFQYGMGYLNWVEIEAAYSENWIAEQIVNAPVDDALREWRKFNLDDDSEIRREEERLQVRHHYKLGRYWARLYGGAVLIMLTDQPLEKPLDVNRLKKGSLKRLVAMDRWDVQGHEINFNEPLADDFLQPRYYTVFGGNHTIHSSHVIRLEGKELPRRLKALNEGWGDSVMRRVMEDLRDVVGSKSGIATMILESNVDVISREGLSDELASGQEAEILKRYALAGQMKSLVNQLLLDGTETYERKQISFAGLGEVLDRFMMWISGAAEIPATRLFGQAPQGMDATGEGDLNNYYDALASMQEADFRRDLKKLDEVMIRSALGEMPDEYGFEFNPLYQESGVELAQQDLATAQAEEVRLNQGIIQPSHVARRLQAEGKYGLTDEEITRMEEDEQGLRDEPGEEEEEEGDDDDALAALTSALTGGGDKPDENEDDDG